MIQQAGGAESSEINGFSQKGGTAGGGGGEKGDDIKETSIQNTNHLTRLKSFL